MATQDHGAGEWARRFITEIWDERNLDAIDDLIAADFVEHSPMSPEPIRGPDGVRASVQGLLTAFPDASVDLAAVVGEGDRVAVRATATGTHEGSFMGVEPTGRSIEVPVAAIQRIEAGKAVEEWQLLDTLGLLRQLGVVELPAPEHDRHTSDTRRPTMTSTTSIERNKRLARRFPEEVATAGEIDRIDELCTADVIEHTPQGVLRGRDALKAQSESIHAAFPDVSVAIEDEIADADLVAHRLTFRGTHEGAFMGIEPTGNAVEIANMLFTRIDDGRIAERWLLADMLGLLEQVGAIDPPTA